MKVYYSMVAPELPGVRLSLWAVFGYAGAEVTIYQGSTRTLSKLAEARAAGNELSLLPAQEARDLMRFYGAGSW